ncbi:chemotaxis protein methyltransferase CheR [Thermovibrio guaymasensis]|uniref:Chemotaxis protein methyltransferase CheR n=1 Tax=Thermovibrio guaymasensis TaxID=240167 RepID=A0A420W9C8_9BACT|nr:protein-glutamate O-methyltransferase CheR [Thermovibrio guaymasensis]RKQ63872.1 chemotaxis protein methyltransferase CheR [Thermovibrio guaymasensis]
MELTNYELGIIRRVVKEKTGIDIPEKKLRNIYKRKFEKLLKEEEISFFDFISSLDKDVRLLDKFISLVTVNETYFFREYYQIRSLVDFIIPELEKEKTQIRILSAPCASGEEVYSIAIEIFEKLPEIKEKIFIIGLDIDWKMIGNAKKGVYNLRSIQKVEQDLLDKYFDKVDGGCYKVKSFLKTAVSFHRANVLNIEDLRKFKYVDIVFSRNLLIYFDEVAREKTIKNFYEIMSPRGYLFLGHAEKIPRNSSHLFEKRKVGESYVYIAKK